MRIAHGPRWATTPLENAMNIGVVPNVVDPDLGVS